MERLTKRLEDGQAVVDCVACENAENECCLYQCRNRLKDRLAAYEDTELEPEEVADLLTIHRGMAGNEYVILDDELRSILFAKNEGRLLVLPCKVGDTVYKLCTVSAFLKKGDLWSGRIIERDCDMCGYVACDCHDIGPRNDGSGKNIVHELTVKSVGAIVRIMPHWGKFYFLTREEAEAALEGGEG